MTKHYAEFLYHDGWTTRSEVREVASRDPIPKNMIPIDAFGYRFHDTATQQINGTSFTSEPINRSGIHYIDAQVFDAEGVTKAFPKEAATLKKNMENFNCDRVVFTRIGGTRFFTVEDKLV